MVLIVLSMIVAALVATLATESLALPKTTTVYASKTVAAQSSLSFAPPIYVAAVGSCFNMTLGYIFCGVYNFSGASLFNCWKSLSDPGGCIYHFGSAPENGTAVIRFLGSNFIPEGDGFNCEYNYLGPSPSTEFQGLCYPFNSTAFVIMEPGSPGGDLNVH